jgi:histidine ammonia-lyase
MLLRANCLAKGNSGVRLELIERLVLFLNQDVLPLIPERRSCRASGDLIPLSYVGSTLAATPRSSTTASARRRGTSCVLWTSSRSSWRQRRAWR